MSEGASCEEAAGAARRDCASGRLLGFGDGEERDGAAVKHDTSRRLCWFICTVANVLRDVITM